MTEHKRMKLDDAIDVLLDLYTRDRRTERGFEYLEITVAASDGWRSPNDLTLAWEALAARRAVSRNGLSAKLRGLRYRVWRWRRDLFKAA